MSICAQHMLKLSGYLNITVADDSNLEIRREVDGSHGEPAGIKVTAV